MAYNRKSHSVFLLTYHIVFVTKNRRPVITDEIGDFMKDHAAYLCGRFGGDQEKNLGRLRLSRCFSVYTASG